MEEVYEERGKNWMSGKCLSFFVESIKLNVEESGHKREGMGGGGGGRERLESYIFVGIAKLQNSNGSECSPTSS